MAVGIMYTCGAILLTLSLLGLLLRIAKGSGKREDANAAAWRQMHQERLQREARLAELKMLSKQ